MAWADTLAGLSIANAGVTLPHGIGMAMSGLYPHVAHGEALAAVYPAVMRYSWQSAPGKFAVVARIFDPSLISSPDKRAAQKSCDVIGAFNREIGMGISLKKLKIPEKEIRTLAEASLVLPDYKNHPRVATLDEVCELLKRSFR
jgi:alcohol dehydrogenase class IV